MQRSDKNKPLWKKITPGVLYPFAGRGSRRVKPQEQIRASQEELEKCLDHFELLENGKGEFKVDIKAKEVIEEPDGENYTVQSVGSGWYNVLSPTGEVMNEKKLRAEEAEEYKASFEEETNTQE